MECPYEKGMGCMYIDTSSMMKTRSCKDCPYYKLHNFREEAFRYAK